MPRRTRRQQNTAEDDGSVRGPSSALTSFLREQGINAESVRLRYEENTRREQEMAEMDEQLRQQQLDTVEEEGIGSTEGVSATVSVGLPDNLGLDSDEEVYEGDEEDGEVVRIRERARAKRRKVDGEDGDLDGSHDVGKNYCIECDKEFVVTVYSKKMEKYGRVGYLCPSCTKIAIRRERLIKRTEIEARKRRKKIAAALLDKQAYSIPSLQDFCVKIISDNINDVDLLGDIGTNNRQKICRILAKKRSLDSKTMQLFLDPSMKELEFWDCSKIDKAALNTIPSYCPKLESLTLNMCGHLHMDNLLYYGDKMTNLRYLNLNGPFLINNDVWQDFFDSKVGKNLTAFHLRNTHRFTSDSLVALLDNVGDRLEELTLSRLDGLDSKLVYDLLPHYLHSMRHLELSYPHKEDLVDDDMIVNLVANNGEHLETLILDGCSYLTDQFLVSGIKPFCPNLTKLSLNQLDQITDNGMTQLFTDWNINGGLMDLNLSRCVSLTDASIYKALEHSSQTLVELNLNSLSGISRKMFLRLSRNIRFPLLTSVDIGFVRSVDDSALAIWSRIAPRLSILEVYGNSRCTDKAIVRADLRIIGREADSI
ncbi:DEKNAAC105565 [Brettanomyces naardenensis]|uniref:DEKNAAC105565 n=1 Tax=Brettanomyces naardenensis TaxID=13370 RepID=A0A448YTZ8_BRENA|nr:DEKNAAC105565 [Brettanomyces naardenensis]